MPVVLIPTEAYAGAPHRSAIQLVVGLIAITILGCPLIERSILRRSIEEQGEVHTQTIGELQRVRDIPLVLDVET